jgi:hypothetical protein
MLRHLVLGFVLLGLVLPFPLPAIPKFWKGIDLKSAAAGVVLEGVVDLCLYAANWMMPGEDPDPVEAEELEMALKEHLAELEAREKDARANERKPMQEGIRSIRETQRLLALARSVDAASLALLRKDLGTQKEQLARIESRLDGMDAKLDHVVDRLDQQNGLLVEIADHMTAECRDLRGAPIVLGTYRVPDDEEAALFERETIQEGRVDTQVFLETCTRQLDRRGLLVLFGLQSRVYLKRPELWISVKDVMNRGQVLWQSHYRLDARGDAEIFIPYSDLPLHFPTARFELALVLAVDRQPIYSVVGNVVECQPGVPQRCFWFH